MWNTHIYVSHNDQNNHLTHDDDYQISRDSGHILSVDSTFNVYINDCFGKRHYLLFIFTLKHSILLSHRNQKQRASVNCIITSRTSHTFLYSSTRRRCQTFFNIQRSQRKLCITILSSTHFLRSFSCFTFGFKNDIQVEKALKLMFN